MLLLRCLLLRCLLLRCLLLRCLLLHRALLLRELLLRRLLLRGPLHSLLLLRGALPFRGLHRLRLFAPHLLCGGVCVLGSHQVAKPGLLPGVRPAALARQERGSIIGVYPDIEAPISGVLPITRLS